MRARLLLLLLLALPSVGATALTLQVPEDLRLADGALLSGMVTWHTQWQDPAIVEPAMLEFGEGILTVCEKNTRGASLLETLAEARGQCPGQTMYQVSRLTVMPGARLRFAGEHGAATTPISGFATVSGGSSAYGAMVTDDLVTWNAPQDGFSFGAATEATAMWAEIGEETVWFNGTEQTYLHDGAAVSFTAAAFGAGVPGDTKLDVVPVGANATTHDGYRLLDVQEALLGADAREARTNVTDVLSEFGRVPQFIDGAVFGRLNGTVADIRLDPTAPSLLRADTLHLALKSDHLEGDAELVYRITPDGFALGTEAPAKAPWVWGIVLWAAALLIAIPRRHMPKRRWYQWPIAPIATLGALYMVDQRILGDVFGASAWSLWRDHAAWGPVLALLTLELAILGLAAVLVLVPLRIGSMKAVPDRWTWIPDLVASGLWLLSLYLWPTAYFALGYSVARL